MTTYDVVVVGARVAGASTALLLARAGLRVALVDRGAYGTDTPSTHALMRAGVMQLSRWGLLEQVVALGTPPVRRTVFHYAGDTSVDVTIRPGGGVDALYAPRRQVLDRLLVDAAAEAGAEVTHRTAATSLLRGPDGTVRGVRVTGRDGRRRDLRATVTVGADGIRSEVAAQVGATVQRTGRHAGAVIYRYFADLPAAGYEWAYGDAATAGLIPTNGGLTCAFVGAPPQRVHELRRDGSEATWWRLLDAAAPELVDRVRSARPASRLHGWSGTPGHVRRSWGPGWALVGDAGYFKDPCTAHGMTDALRDAELLADAILDVVGGWAPERVALARYQLTRDRLSRQLFEATERVATFSWSVEEVQGLLRQVNAAMSDEVDHLQALPTRPVGRGSPGFGPTDTAPVAR